MNVSTNYFNRLGSFERCSNKIFNWQVEDSWGILCILHVLNVLYALLQLYIYSHYGVINEQVMPPLPRHEYGRMGAVCRRSRGMGNEKVNQLQSETIPMTPPLKPMSCWLWLDIQEAKGQRASIAPKLAGQTMLLYSHTLTCTWPH